MKAMGLNQLWLVAPKLFPCAEATARAAGADDILVKASVVTELREALVDCRLVVATTARQRSIPWPALEPRACVRRIKEIGVSAPIALVFGREHSGLSNEELEACNLVTTIPTSADFSSLNVAAAVQVLCYELRLAWLETEEATTSDQNDRDPLASADELSRLYEHLQRVLAAVRFAEPDRSESIMRRLKRLFTKAALEHREVQILRGILSAVEESLITQ
jgi:tRNA (cytidine32/uridine32-2'-O)-methyltransferase